MNKDAAALQAVAVQVMAARKYVRYHDSQAEDAGTESRNQKQLLTRVVNNISSSKEYPVNMVAYGLLGGEPFSGSNSQQWSLFPWVAVLVIIKNTKKREGADIENDSDSDDDDTKRIDCDDDDDVDDDDDDDDDDNDDDDNGDYDEDPFRYRKREDRKNKRSSSNIFAENSSGPNVPISYGMSFVYNGVDDNGNPAVLPIQQHLAYHYRGIFLRHLSFCEYFQLMQIERTPAPKKTSTKTTNTSSTTLLSPVPPPSLPSTTSTTLPSLPTTSTTLPSLPSLPLPSPPLSPPPPPPSSYSTSSGTTHPPPISNSTSTTHFDTNISSSASCPLSSLPPISPMPLPTTLSKRGRKSKGILTSPPPTTSSKRGRKSNGIFQFEKDCPFGILFRQKLRSQYPLWILCGKSPPKYDIKNWRQGKKMSEANIYAQYWLTIMIPWDYDIATPTKVLGPPGTFDYAQFRAWAGNVQMYNPHNFKSTIELPSVDFKITCPDLIAAIPVPKNHTQLKDWIEKMYKFSKGTNTVDVKNSPSTKKARRNIVGSDDIFDHFTQARVQIGTPKVLFANLDSRDVLLPLHAVVQIATPQVRDASSDHIVANLNPRDALSSPHAVRVSFLRADGMSNISLSSPGKDEYVVISNFGPCSSSPPLQTFYGENCCIAVLVNDASMNIRNEDAALMSAFRARMAEKWTAEQMKKHKEQNDFKDSKKSKKDDEDNAKERMAWLQLEQQGGDVKRMARVEKMQSFLRNAWSLIHEGYISQKVSKPEHCELFTMGKRQEAEKCRTNTKKPLVLDDASIPIPPPLTFDSSFEGQFDSRQQLLNILDPNQDCALLWLSVAASVDVSIPDELKDNTEQAALFTLVITNIRDRGIWYKRLYGHIASGKQMNAPDKSGPPQLLTKIIGSPGVGKTFTFNLLYTRVATLHLDFIKAAYTASASVLIDGQTLHSCFKFPSLFGSKKKSSDEVSLTWTNLNTENLQVMIKQFHNKVATFIDEDSLIPSTFLDLISCRHVEVLQNTFKEYDHSNRPFGGFSVILCGDPFQIGPVGGSMMHKEVIADVCPSRKLKKTKKSNPTAATKTANGLQLFTNFELFVMKKQMRAKDDVIHSHFIENLRSRSKTFPVDKYLIEHHIKDFTTDDMRTDPEWEFPTFVVSTNAERCQINKMQMKKFAQKTSQPGLSWRLPLKDDTIASEMMAEDDKEGMYICQPESMFNFVSGARVVFVDLQVNRVDKRVAKGTVGTMYSIFCTSMKQQEEIIAKGKQSSETGDIVMLSFVPSHILVRLTDEKTRLDWEKTPDGNFVDSMVEGDLVISMPLGESNVTIKMGDLLNVLLSAYGVEPAYAISFHKLQGYTCKRLVLQLNFSKGGLFVIVIF